MLKKVAVFLFVLFIACGGSQALAADSGATPGCEGSYQTAIFAGGLFWAIASPFKETPGVVEVVNGYTGGSEEDPKFLDVASGKTGHVMAVKVVYDPAKVAYTDLLGVFWKNIDPTDDGGQFSDRGSQFRAVIFYQDDKEKEAAERSKAEIETSGRFEMPIVTEIAPASTFYKAEKGYQDVSNIKSRKMKFEIMQAITERDEFTSKVWGADR